MNGKAFETKLNVLVGRLLSEKLGLKAISESISSHKRPDVVIFVNGIKIIIEGSYSKRDAELDVEKRIEEGLADIGIALHYKEDFPSNITDSELEKRLQKSSFEVRIVIPKDISNTLIRYLQDRKILPSWVTGWMEAKITDLESILNEGIQFILSEKDVEEMMNEIEKTTNDFIQNINSIDGERRIAKKLYDVFYKLYGLSIGDYEKISELIYAKTALALLLSIAFYQSIHAELGLENLTYFLKYHGPRLGIEKAFEEILEVDYKPIYDVARQVIGVLPDKLSNSMEELAELASKMSSKSTILRRDFAGKIYHRVVGDWSVRKGFATYFTTVPAAYLLAYLAVFARTGVFSNFRKIKMGDLACGSGTLLTASYNALRDLYIYSTFKQGTVNIKNFHKQMLEDGIWGFDALRYAVQIASTNLVLQNPTVEIDKMNMFAIPLGKENDNIWLGSLEFIRPKGERLLPKISAFFASEPVHIKLEGMEPSSITGNEEVPSELPEFDFIIMNPPFTRATGRGGKEKGGLFGFIVDESLRKQITGRYNEIRKKIQEQLEIIHDHGAALNYKESWLNRLGISKELFNIGQAGEGLLFLYLASNLVREGGKIAFVLPKSLLTGISWFLARSLLLNKFHLEHIVVSYDAEKGYNFSESTSLSETLIVARKGKASKGEDTTITVLLSKPSTSLEARALAFKITKVNESDYLEVNGSKAYVYKIPREKLIERLHNWGSLLAFPDPKLTRIADEVLSGKIFNTDIPMVRLGEIATIGIDRRQFHDAFKKVKGRPPASYPIIYGGGEEIRRYMFTEPNSRVISKTVKTKKGETKMPGDGLFKEFSSNLLIPDRIRVDTAHVIAMYCKEPVLSNIFYALRLKSNKNTEERLKALCVWLNTTWGILTILANRSETEGGWINLKMTHWRLQPILNVTKLDEDKVEALANIFNENGRRSMRRLPDQFNPDNVDIIRRSIDREFLKTFGLELSEKDLLDMYKLIYENLNKWIREG
jgi:hypothetical protein